METEEIIVKIYDHEKKYIGSGQLLSINNNIIKIKGDDLPILRSRTEVNILLFDNIKGVYPFNCKIEVSSLNQLNAQIIKRENTIERRNSLKVRTDISFYINSLIRNEEDITKEVPNMKINILNLSIGGMLISSNYNLLIDDVISFYFKYDNYEPIILYAKIIRIDKKQDRNNDLIIEKYGCSFNRMSNYNESLITKYLFERQLQLYKNR